MASACPFSNPEKGHPEAISFRRTSEETIRSHKFEKDLRRYNQKP
jgi:hypothetical protein